MRFDKGKKEIQVNFALIRRCGGTFSLRAKSRLQRLRSDTRLRAQPLGGRLRAPPTSIVYKPPKLRYNKTIKNFDESRSYHAHQSDRTLLQ